MQKNAEEVYAHEYKSQPEQRNAMQPQHKRGIHLLVHRKPHTTTNKHKTIHNYAYLQPNRQSTQKPIDGGVRIGGFTRQKHVEKR
jgi:hypothetical protein